MEQNCTKSVENGYDLSVVRQTSMGTLIMWNISKAIKTNPHINLKSSLEATQERLQGSMTGESDMITSLKPEEQYLSCAMLAWQQLGHTGTASLYQFIETKQKECKKPENNTSEAKGFSGRKPMQLSPGSFISYNDPSLGSSNYQAVGPVVKLPVDTTRIVMRVDNTPCPHQLKKKSEKGLMDKIDAACCMESVCIDRLSKLDKATTELRSRAQRLARREAQRVELLERAETAWRDLEMGYQRRLAAAQEKEEDMTKHIEKLIEERNGHKNACSSLAQQLREKGETAEKERARLTDMEKEMYDNACVRMQLSEEVARLDAKIAELQCKSAQLDRDLQFKEEQIRGKLLNMQNEVDCARALTHEADRTVHSELSALRDQITSISGHLLEEDSENITIKEEMTQLRQEKTGMLEDLEGCQVLCTGRIQGTIDELNKKRETLKELKEKVTECQCKLPVDAAVEVKRTPSLAALCNCQPDDRFSETCSCTSLRTTLLTNLLCDLFGGLQSEMGGCGAEMPCQLLKCLEDKHNWDKSSVIKTNLRNYFSKLLIGELEIAIATSIENYHARWVGSSCADPVRPPSINCGTDGSDWQERVVERRAQKLVCKLAEELFQKRADQLTAKAKDILKAAPPCECNRSSAAVYPVFVKPPTLNVTQPSLNSMATPAYWRRTHQNVTQLRAQLEDLKKVALKKEDLKIMEDNIVKVVQRSVPENVTEAIEFQKEMQKKKRKEISSIHRSVNTEQTPKHLQSNKLSIIKKKQLDVNIPKKVNKNFMLGFQIDKPLKKLEQSYAVNLCLCGSQKAPKKTHQEEKQGLNLLQNNDSKIPFKTLSPKYILPQASSVKQTKPITIHSPSDEINSRKKSNTVRPPCRSDLACFHKPPSNTSIEKLLETLAKWKCDLSKLNNNCEKTILDKNYINQTMNKNTKYVEENKTFDKNEDIDKKYFKNVATKISAVETQEYRRVSKQIVANISESIEVPRDLPITTDSEYMGAINLEKSNENYCKCVTDIDVNNKLENSSFSHKCINSENCNCNSLSRNEKDSPSPKGSNNATSSSTKLQNVHTDSPKQMSRGDININLTNNRDHLPNRDFNQIKTSSSFSNDCEYCIKFLGATLTNAYPRKNILEESKNCLNVRQKNHCKNIKPDIFYDDMNRTVKCNGDDIENFKNLSTPKTNVASCDCISKYDEFKNLVSNVISKQRGDFCKNEDKALDTRSLSYNIMPESCVCCNIVKTDESKDLELNAFYLLEEHLKGKLEDFKNSTCKSSCISSQEEERLFSNILERVKQVITVGTSSIACKCISEDSSGGSWHRAYVLLQEYLKIKMKRVQCLCTSSDEKKVKVLPEIMEKVYNLIDNDFQRLKDVCKCNNRGSGIYNNINTIYQTELPERDNDHSQNLEVTVNTQTSKKEVEFSNNTIAQNMSSQVSYNFGIDTKSCDAMRIKEKSEDFQCQYEKCDCCSSTKANKCVDFGETEFLVNQCTDIFNNPSGESNNENFQRHIAPEFHTNPLNVNNKSCKNIRENMFTLKFPYIGYTVDCSCHGSLGTCFCTKSLVTRNIDDINSIWNSLTSNKSHRCDFSYIMDSVSKRNKDADSSAEIKKKQLADIDPVKPPMCDTEVNVRGEEDIALKDSKAKLHKIFISATTSRENVSFGTKEPIDWCDCSSSKHKPQRMTDFSDNTCEDVLYYPLSNLKNRQGSEVFAKARSPSNVTCSLSSNCDCNMVPLCHVKMLVENIEKKLIYSKCTCDSLCSEVCPVHSKKN